MAYTTIKKPSDYFRTKLYTGNGSTQSLTWEESENMKPDWLWGKIRTGTGSHNLCDVVRGATKILYSNLTDAEATDANSFTSFDTNGFSIGSQSNINASGASIVTWGWSAGGTGVSNTDGSITSTVSANTTSGFSIVSFTGNGTAGATVGHGLGKKPDIIIEKNRVTTGGYNWNVYSSALGATYIGALNDSSAFGTAGGTIYWNDTEPTSSVFSLGSSGQSNTSGAGYIAYCFTSIKGFSKFGSYTGNGSADGTFVYTGFKPAFVIIKQTNTTRSWHMFDNKRNEFNVVDKFFFTNSSGAEQTLSLLDFTSNGFKTRSTDGAVNASGGSYIYMAFAEEPLVGDNPATAR